MSSSEVNEIFTLFDNLKKKGSFLGSWFLFIYLFIYLFNFVFFLELHPQHMEVSRLGAELELWLPAYTTATAMPDLSRICDLHCN